MCPSILRQAQDVQAQDVQAQDVQAQDVSFGRLRMYPSILRQAQDVQAQDVSFDHSAGSGCTGSGCIIFFVPLCKFAEAFS